MCPSGEKCGGGHFELRITEYVCSTTESTIRQMPPKRRSPVHAMQLVVVSEVAMAVRMVMTKCRILLQSSFLFMVLGVVLGVSVF